MATDIETIRVLRVRVEGLEGQVREIPTLKLAVESANERTRLLTERSDELASAVRQLGDTHARALETFMNMLQTQRADYMRERRSDAEAFRDDMKSLKNEYIASHERIVEETLARLSGAFMRGGWETISKWIWALIASGVAIFFGWLYHKLYISPQ